jgi:uncharacterized membrane protein YdjX (TVP38/TMEM64 family)
MGPRHVLAVLLAFGLAAFLAALTLHLLPMPSLAALRGHEDDLTAYGAAYPLRLAAIFVIAYVVLAPLPVPAAELLTVAAGTLFGLAEGVVLVSIAAMIGSCGAFLLGRFLLGRALRRRLAGRIAMVARGVEREGAFYLFALHMIPAMPFFIVNMAMGATSLRLATFCWVSQLGILPIVIAYVNAGIEIGRFHSLSGILSPGVLATFAVLGVLPLAARPLVATLRRRIGGIWGDGRARRAGEVELGASPAYGPRTAAARARRAGARRPAPPSRRMSPQG